MRVEVTDRSFQSVLWAAAISMCIVMEGYDTALLGNFYALPSFQAKYGKYFPDLGEYQVEAKWQVALGQGSSIGNFCERAGETRIDPLQSVSSGEHSWLTNGVIASRLY